MKIVRYDDGGQPRYGIVEDDTVYRGDGDLFAGLAKGERVGKLADLTVLVPVEPSKIVAVGLNYRRHIEEMARGRNLTIPDEPVIFMKPPTALLPDGGVIDVIPGDRTDFEAEICIIMGKEAYRVPEERAFDYVLGYTCGNDVSNRSVFGGGQFTRGKGFNGYAPLGPVIETELDPDHVMVSSRLNGEVRQNASTETMLFGCAHLISFISNIMTLLPGDVIMTGTPEGVGSLQPGDTIEVEVEGIGVLRNTTRARE